MFRTINYEANITTMPWAVILPNSMFWWPCITVYQYSETNVMHFLFNLLTIRGLYTFRALLANPQEALHKRYLVYCVCVMSVGCTRIGVGLQSWVSCTLPSRKILGTPVKRVSGPQGYWMWTDGRSHLKIPRTLPKTEPGNSHVVVQCINQLQHYPQSLHSSLTLSFTVLWSFPVTVDTQLLSLNSTISIV
jgi:hypothetical protein